MVYPLHKISVSVTLRMLEPAPALFSFDNIVFPQPARHNLQLCYARPIAADVFEPSVADLGFHLSVSYATISVRNTPQRISNVFPTA